MSPLRRYKKLLIRLVAVLFACAICNAQIAADTSDEQLPLGWYYNGDLNGCELGRSVASAGDVDNNGLSDAIIGAPLGEKSTDRQGVAYVFLGPVTSLSPVPDHILEGPHQGSDFGRSVAPAGDVNNDGHDDIIVGAPRYKPDDEMPEAGAAFIYYGPLSSTSPPPDGAIIGEEREVQLGTSVAGVGDINQDGYDDVAIGVPRASNGEDTEGQVLIVYGSTTGLLTEAAQIETIEMDQAHAMFGSSVAGAGDINGDTYADVIVGAPRFQHNGTRNGAAFVFLGSNTGLASDPVWTAYGTQAYTDTLHAITYGAVVGTAGDVNADGYSDWFVSAPGYDGNYVDEGQVQVYYGRGTDLADISAGWTRTGGATGARYGAGAGSAGDINGDGYGDLGVGAPYYENTSGGDSGKDEPEAVFVYLGSASGLRLTRAWEITSTQATPDFGAAVSSAGDTNGDGRDDLLIGAPHYKKEENDLPGKAFSYLGVEGNGNIVFVYLPLVMRCP